MQSNNMETNEDYRNNHICVVCQLPIDIFYGSGERPLCDRVAVCSPDCYSTFFRIGAIYEKFWNLEENK